jgi:integrase/recombinase XerD
VKVNGNGQAKILSQAELDRLFDKGFSNNRDRCLFAICFYTGCRISEALALTINDVGTTITFRKATTKGKKGTRSIPAHTALRKILDAYLQEFQPDSYLFPSFHNAREKGHLHRSSADLILRTACDRVGLKGVSTHSFRRSALTLMSNRGVPLRVIQKISGHSSLEVLQRYLEVSDQQIGDAVGVLGE